MRDIIIGIAILAGCGVLLFMTRSRNGKDVIKSDFGAQGLALVVVAGLMAAGGFIVAGVVGW